MRKKALIIILICLAVVITTIVVLCVCLCESSDSDTFVDENGVTVVNAKNPERINAALKSGSSQLELRLSPNMVSFNDVTINDSHARDYLIINGNNNVYSNIAISTNATKVRIKDITINNNKYSQAITVSGANAHLILENCKINCCDNGGVAICINSVYSTLIVKGYSDLRGGMGGQCQDGGNALQANYITVSGNGKLSLYGGKGGVGKSGRDGSNGVSYSTSRTTVNGVGSDGTAGGNGTNGEDGQSAGKGGDALACQELIVKEQVKLYCVGGDGNKSGDGGDGGDGGNGQGAFRPSPMQFKTYDGGRGGNGGNAGSGANEQRPGYGIICNKATISSSTTVTVKSGIRGSAGKGGTGGAAGKGGESSGGSLNDWGGKGNAPDGDIGKSGVNGNALAEVNIKAYVIGELSGSILI